MHAAPPSILRAAVPPSKRSERLVGERVLGRPRDSPDAAVTFVFPSISKGETAERDDTSVANASCVQAAGHAKQGSPRPRPRRPTPPTKTRLPPQMGKHEREVSACT